MQDKKSILFVMNTMGRAGAERALIELMKILNLEQYRISLFVLIPRGELFDEVPEYVKILNRKTDNRSVLSFGGKMTVISCLAMSALRYGSLTKAAGRLIRAKKSVGSMSDGQIKEKILRRLLADGMPELSGKYDLAVAYLEGPATWFVAEKVCAIQKAAFLHIDYKSAGYSNELDMGCYEKYNRIYAVSEAVRKSFLSVYPKYKNKTKIFFNIINRENIRKNAEKQGGFSDDFTGVRLLTVGRLHFQKGYDIAVKTAALLKNKGCVFRWYVLGEGEEKKNIQRLIRDYKLENEFILLGASDNPYPYFRQADIYVCTSRFEGKSIVIEEAQALGKPVVATDCTGIDEQIQNGYDGIITGMKEELLADAVTKLIQNPGLREKYGYTAYNKRQRCEEGLKDFFELAGNSRK